MTTIAALGIVAILFMALMSAFYLQQLPSKADLGKVEADVRRDHGLYLAASEPVELDLVLPDKKGSGVGIRVDCTLRPDIRKKAESIDLHLQRICETILLHPVLEGRVKFVRARHAAEPVRRCTRRYEELGIATAASAGP